MLNPSTMIWSSFFFSTILISTIFVKDTVSFAVGPRFAAQCGFIASKSCKIWTESSPSLMRPKNARGVPTLIYAEQKDNEIGDEDSSSSKKSSSADEIDDKEKKDEAIGNLVADDEWIGLSYELSELVRTAVVEDMKKNARDFLGKDEYKIGDISKEIDKRVKDEVSAMRNKDEYELGDFVIAMDEMSKNFTEDLTGKPYEFGDLSKEIDKRIKEKVAEFCGKEPDADQYEFGDLSREVDRRIKSRVADFTGRDSYEFGDISNEVERRRKEWIKDYLGEEAAANYQFGDITKKAVTSFTGKEKYEFGDVTKKIMGDLFGPRKKGKKED